MSNPNDDDHLRLLSDAEREAMEADDNDYDPEEDNAAALAALGRGPLDAEEEEEGDDADAANGKPEPTRRVVSSYAVFCLKKKMTGI
ncbi:hypothetical protein bcgnr5379_61750 [Bacillus cereus]